MAGESVMVFLDSEPPSDDLIRSTDKPLLKMLEKRGLIFRPGPLANEKNYVSQSRSLADRHFIFSNLFTSHDSVLSLANNEERIAVLAYRAGFVETKNTEGYKLSETVRSLSDTFVDSNENFKFDPDEKKSSYGLGAVSEAKEKSKSGKTAKLVVFGDAQVASDALLRNRGNMFFLVESVRWLVGDSKFSGALSSEEDVKD